LLTYDQRLGNELFDEEKQQFNTQHVVRTFAPKVATKFLPIGSHRESCSPDSQ